jgi:hypothetical protein
MIHLMPNPSKEMPNVKAQMPIRNRIIPAPTGLLRSAEASSFAKAPADRSAGRCVLTYFSQFIFIVTIHYIRYFA